MNKEWIELISELETYEISPFEINKCVIEFAKALLELEARFNEPQETPSTIKEEIGQSTLDFIDESLPPSMQK